MLSLAPLKNLPHLVNNKKNKNKKKQKLDNETSVSVDGNLWTEKTSLKFITKTKQN